MYNRKDKERELMEQYQDRIVETTTVANGTDTVFYAPNIVFMLQIYDLIIKQKRVEFLLP